MKALARHISCRGAGRPQMHPRSLMPGGCPKHIEVGGPSTAQAEFQPRLFLGSPSSVLPRLFSKAAGARHSPQ